FGAAPARSGEILIAGRGVTLRSVGDAIAAGIGYVPEDRKASGLFLAMTVAENIAAASLDRFGNLWTDDSRRDATARDFAGRLHMAIPGVDAPIRNLSGGNQQKAVLSRWFLRDPRILIVDEPTRGVDVGAKWEVHAILREMAAGGKAVVVISSDLPEVLALGSRV